MYLKNYLILEVPSNRSTIKMKIRKGFLQEEIRNTFSPEDVWEPAENERLYFLPGCTVPRFKVREKFNVTIKPEYATSVFIPTKEFKAAENLLEVCKYTTLDTESIQEYYVNAYGENHYLTIKLKSLLLNCAESVLIDYNSYNRWYYNSIGDTILQTSNLGDVISDRDRVPYPFHKTSQDFYIIDPEFINKIKCPIYTQDAILKILNVGKIVINEKKYRELQLMAQSNDQADLILVMELMANSDYDKSFVYLLLLLKEFDSKIIESPTASHVNFKALLEYFGLDLKQLKNLNIEMFTSLMKSHKQFTRLNVQRLTQAFGVVANIDFETTNYLNGPVLRPEVERELDDFITDSDEIRINEEY